MEYVKKFAQVLWKIVLSIAQSIKRLIQWWFNKIKTSGSRKGQIAWLVGGLFVACFACSFLYTLTPTGRQSIIEGQATQTAVAIAEATSQTETRNAPTTTPVPTDTPAPTNTPSPTSPPTATSPPTNTPRPTNTFEPAEALQFALQDALGDSNRENAERVTVDIIDNIVFVTFAIQDNFSADWIRTGMANDTLEILNVVHNSGIPYDSVSITGTFPLRDAFGNVEERSVLGATYNRDTIERINFSGSVLVFDIADEPVFIHQAMLED